MLHIFIYNEIGDNGAKNIGEGISKLTLLTYLYLAATSK